MSFARQFVALLAMSLSGFAQRVGSVLTIVIGVTCAVAVLVSMLSMGTGARREALGNARDDRVVFTSLGAQGIGSSIPRDGADTVLNLLAVEFAEGAAPSGAVTLLFSGGGALRLEVECLEVELADLGPARRALRADHPGLPNEHEDRGDESDGRDYHRDCG